MINNCPFCNYKDTSGQKVYESENVYAIVSNTPINRYHVLVIPKKHYENLIDLPKEISQEIIQVVQKLSLPVRKAAKADAVTHVTEDEVGEKGYNLVKHFKFHIIPRYEKDMHLMNWQPLRVEVSSEKIRQIASEIRNFI